MVAFYSQADQDIYDEGDHFIPQEYYRLNKFNNTVAPVPPEIIPEVPQSFGIPYTNAFTGGGGGGGGGLNDYGLDMSNTKMFDKNVYSRDMVSGPQEAIASGKTTPTFSWQNKQVQGFYHPNTGQYRTAKGKNIEHGGINFKPMLASLFGVDKEGPQIGDIEGTFTHGWESGKDKIKKGWEEEKDKWAGIFGMDKIKKARAFKAYKKEQDLQAEIDAWNKAQSDKINPIGTPVTPQHHQDVSRGPGGGGGEGHQAQNIRDIKDEGPGITASSGMHGGKHYAQGGRAGFFEGALADTKEGKAMSPGTSASGGTHEGGYGRDTPPKDTAPKTKWITKNNLTVDTNLIDTKPSAEINYDFKKLPLYLQAKLHNRNLLTEDNINLEGQLGGSIGPIDWSSYFDQEGATGSRVGLGPFETNIDPNKNIKNISFDQNIGDFNVRGNTDLENYNLGIDYNRGPFFAGATTDNMGNTNFNVGAKWSWGQPERPVNALSYDDLIYGQTLRHGGLVGLL